MPKKPARPKRAKTPELRNAVLLRVAVALEDQGEALTRVEVLLQDLLTQLRILLAVEGKLP